MFWLNSSANEIIYSILPSNTEILYHFYFVDKWKSREEC